MLPTQNTGIVALGISRLTSANKRQTAPGVYARPNLIALLSATLAEVQLLENVFWQIIGGDFLATAALVPGSVNVVLDKLGALVGQPRLGLNNALYAAAIALRILANRSHGRAEDIIQIAAAVAYISANGILPPGTPIAPPGTVNYIEGYPASVEVDAYDVLPAFVPIAQSALAIAMPLGVYGIFGYSLWPDGNDFEWADVNNLSTTGEGTFGDSVGGAVGGLLISAVPITGPVI